MIMDYKQLSSRRSINELFEKGFIVLDKDAGPTSHQCVDNLKKVLSIEKAGHSGTLDPQVTGVLVTGLGKATRLMEYMLESDKEYVCLCFFHKPITKEQIEEVFNAFTGTIKQTPPVISAVKRVERERTIYKITLLDIHEDMQHVLFRVSCQHGTYIRKLCTDMGEYLGINAQMKELRRTKAGPFTEKDNCIGLDTLRNLYELYQKEENKKNKECFEKELKKYIRPYEELLKEFPKIFVSNTCLSALSHGEKLFIPGIVEIEGEFTSHSIVGVYSQDNELILVGRTQMNSKEMKENTKGIAVKPEKVFIERE
jgi:H/ACA ribonucleoprotein complex subunit 4